LKIYGTYYVNIKKSVNPELPCRGPPLSIDPAPLLKVHGLDLSYFTGKLEANLRNKGLRYALVEMDTGSFKTMGQRAGVAQMPHLELPDGQLLTDTSHILRWLDEQFPDHPIRPVDPALCWLGDLLEDFGDEWLWRPALYYRWAFRDDARLMSDRLARGMLRDIPFPVALRRTFIRLRQQRVYLRQDGVTAQNAGAIEGLYHATLDALEQALADRPFLLGDQPSQADLGFFGPFFRHFSSDPTPSQILRARAPAVLHWVARMWHPDARLRARKNLPPLQEPGLPSGLGPMLRLVGDEYLPYLAGNEAHWVAGHGSHAWGTQGASFKTPVSPYRVWCWQTLRGAFQQLAAPDRNRILSWFMEIGGTHLQRRLQALLETPLPPEGITACVPWQHPDGGPSGATRDRQWQSLP
jgi:glutathione S-transferase